MDKEQLKKFKDMLDDVKVCMMITAGDNGELRSRPMSAAKIDDSGALWFFTNEYSGKVDEIKNEHKLHLSFSSPLRNTYISINAKGFLVDDKSKMKELWTPMLKAWFPEGLEDPSVLLIKAVPYEIEYWDSPSNRIAVGFNMLKAIATGETYEGKAEHGRINS